MLLLRKKQRNLLQSIVIGGLLLFAVPAIERVTAPVPIPSSAHTLALYVLDVGQGDAIFVQKDNTQILVDGGSNDLVLEKLGALMPAGDTTIELMVSTHPDADHITGLVSVLERYTVARVLMTDVKKDTVIARKFLNAVFEEQAVVDIAPQVQTEQIGDITFMVLFAGTHNDVAGRKYPGSSDGVNDTGIVSKIVYGETEFLLTADVTSRVEEKLLTTGADLTADFLKIGHHGSAYSTSEAFVEAVHPRYAAISVGGKNTYGHPAWRVTQLLIREAITTYRTDHHGDITALTDGHTLQVVPEQVR